ncbi:hypothetical protein ACIQXI_15250 [Lysinibacillus sp. NPDC097195]|uniref:hypothetical protein n=1 Tax=Lysinibacillus sp. NPDC097195 TaxID=3364141 RepID=UPI0037FE04CD
MDDKQFDKRMALLKKSYDRMEQQVDPANVFKQIEEEDKALAMQTIASQQKPSMKWQKRIVWLASCASILLVGLLVSLYTMKQQASPPNEITQDVPDKKAEEEMTDYLIKKFNSKKEEIRKELKVSKDELEAFNFIKNANSTLDFYLTTNLQLRFTDKNYTKVMEKDILNNLMTPKRAVEKIKTFRDLTFEESYAVYSDYIIAVNELETFYSKLLEPYEQLLLKPDDVEYPADLKAIMEAANNQFMQLKIDAGGRFYFKANPIHGEFAPPYINQLHPDILGYFEYLQTGYLLEVDDLRYTREETATSLKIMERTLLADVNASSSDYKLLEETFKNTWVALLLGTKQYPAIADDGQPYSEYLTFLQDVAAGKYGEVMKKTASSILKEFQQSNHSATLSQLAPYDIWIILLQTREETAGYINDSDFIVVDMDDSSINQIKGIYEQYTKNYDDAVLNQLHPLNIVSLYLYAVSIGDESVQKSLLAPDAEVDGSKLQTIESLDVFSQLGEYDGVNRMVAARVAASEQQKYGKQFLIKFSKQENGYYRITEIIE